MLSHLVRFSISLKLFSCFFFSFIEVAQVLFELVDQNKNGALDPPEFLALAAMMDKINAKASPPTPK